MPADAAEALGDDPRLGIEIAPVVVQRARPKAEQGLGSLTRIGSNRGSSTTRRIDQFEPIASRGQLRRGQVRHVRDLTAERVVRAAIRVTDAEGLAALSMRRVATELAAATMTLYRYVSTKDDLLVAMADALFVDAPLTHAGPEGCRAQLELVARHQWSIYRQHAWLAEVISLTRPQVMPHGIATLFGFVRGRALSLEMQTRAEQDTGLTNDQWMAAQETALQRVFASGQYPAVARLEASDIDAHSLFEFGLTRLLDGFAVFFTRMLPL